MVNPKIQIIENLQQEILRLEGFGELRNQTLDAGLGPLNDAFPNGAFPLGAVHEFLCADPADTSSTSGFITSLLSSLMTRSGTALWISASRTLFPPALKGFGVEPDRCIFIDLRNEKEVPWAVDEALKCGALAAVVGEMSELSFTNSRRLQLAVEKSKVTGFIIRKGCRHPGATASISRWRVTSLPCEPADDLPGIGFPKWHVELLRIRNGKPGKWDIIWMNGKFVPVYKLSLGNQAEQRKAG